MEQTAAPIRGGGTGTNGAGSVGVAGSTAASPAASAERVELILAQVRGLPTLSPVAARLLALTSADDANFDEIVALIEADMSLTSRMLALCRRAAAGVATTVTTVKRAVVLLGLEAVQSAVLSVSVFDALGLAVERREESQGGNATARFDRVGLWKHSVAVACCAELLARQHPELKVRPDEAFTAGLVHDLGKVALAAILPRSYERVLEAAHARAGDLAAAERAILGVDHHVAGKRLAEHWGLPYYLADAMWLHGQPASALPNLPHAALVGVVTGADAMCRRLHLGWSGNPQQPPDPVFVAQCANIRPERMAAIEPRLHEMVAQRCGDLGLGEQSPPGLMMESIEQANASLKGMAQSLSKRVTTGRRSVEVLAELRGFLEDTARPTSVEATLRSVLGSFVRWGGAQGHASGVCPPGGAPRGATQGGVALVFQARADEPWVLATLGPGGGAVKDGGADESFDLSSSPGAGGREGAPASLAEMAGDTSMGAASDLLAWLARSAPARAGLEPRRLQRLVLHVAGGASALLLHDRAPAGQAEAAYLETLAAAWGAALSAAARQSGARRVSEALAEANRRLVEAQSRLAEADALARLGELAAGAAHEMNNPLTIISGRGQLLAGRTKDAKDREDARAIAEAADRLTGLVTALHTLARPPMPRIEAVSVRDLLESAARRAKARVGTERGDPTGVGLAPVKISLVSPLDLAGVDAGQFGRAVEELVANALQAGPTRVEVQAWSDPHAGTLVLSVRDDGAGMSDHALAHAFDPFFSELPAGRRTGLGLALARRFVGLHGGSVDLASPGPGRGTTATVTLPGWRYERRHAA